MVVDPTVVIAVIGVLSTGIGAIVRMVYVDIRRDRDYWRDLALELRDINKTAIGVAEKAAKRG